MRSKRSGLGAIVSVIGLLVLGCGVFPPENVGVSPLGGSSVLPTPAATSALATEPTVTLAAMPTSQPFKLVILHTNDNWGETEPCG